MKITGMVLIISSWSDSIQRCVYLHSIYYGIGVGSLPMDLNGAPALAPDNRGGYRQIKTEYSDTVPLLTRVVTGGCCSLDGIIPIWPAFEWYSYLINGIA